MLDSKTGRPFVILCCSPGVDVRPFVAEFFHEVQSNPNLHATLNPVIHPHTRAHALTLIHCYTP